MSHDAKSLLKSWHSIAKLCRSAVIMAIDVAFRVEAVIRDYKAI